VFSEALGRFTFELRGFRLEEERLLFYIRTADGLQLTAIMQWLKQRTGKSEILPGLFSPLPE
jgi:hypothetical protein